MDHIEQRVKAVVVAIMGVTEAEVKNESSFVNDLGADSLDVVEMLMGIEDEFALVDVADLTQGSRMPACRVAIPGTRAGPLGAQPLRAPVRRSLRRRGHIRGKADFRRGGARCR